MAKRKPQRRKRDWRMIFFLAVCALIALSMVVFMVVPALTPPG